MISSKGLRQSVTPTLTCFNPVGADEQDPLEDTGNRGTNDGTENVYQTINFALMFGCAPSVGVRSDTKMCQDVSQALLEGLNDDMYSEFPLFMESV